MKGKQKNITIPDKLNEAWERFLPIGSKESSKNAAGAMLLWMSMDINVRDKCEKLAYSEDIEKAMVQIRIQRIPVLPIQPEEKAVLMPAADFERLFAAMVKAKPALVGKLIVKSLAAVDDNEFASVLSSLKRTRKGRKSSK